MIFTQTIIRGVDFTKKTFIPVLLIILISFSSKNIYSYNSPISYSKQINDTNQQDIYKESVLSLLYPYISTEVDIYYGHPKQFWQEKILSIIKTPELSEYKITVQVETFTGPHNPPRGIETITILTSPMGTKVINFKHESE